jgi:hypothetical protein
MREGDDFCAEIGPEPVQAPNRNFRKFRQIPSKEFGFVLMLRCGLQRWSLRREYLGKEQAA